MNKNWKALFRLRGYHRHGLVLTVGGLAYVFQGIAFFLLEEITHVREASLAVAFQLAPLPVWAGIFVICGLAAVASAGWPPSNDRWGYVVLTGLSSGWATVHLTGYFLGHAPKSNVSFGLVWALLAFMWWGVSGLDNPRPRQPGHRRSLYEPD